MPFQAGKCEGCGHYDYIEFVWAWPRGAWLCRYCREALWDDGEIELEDGTVIRRGVAFVVSVWIKNCSVKAKEVCDAVYQALMKAGMRPKNVEVKEAELCPDCGGAVIGVEGNMGEVVRYCLSCGHRF